MGERHEIWKIADALQMDLRAANAKLVELRSYLTGLNLPEERLRCPVEGCRLPMRGPHTLEEHVRVSHDGPLPAHWQRADELAAAGEREVAQ